MELWREMIDLERTNLTRNGDWLELVKHKIERIEAIAKQTPTRTKPKAKPLTKAERKALRLERAAARLARKMAANTSG